MMGSLSVPISRQNAKLLGEDSPTFPLKPEMSDIISPPDFQETDALLSDLLQNVEDVEKANVSFAGGIEKPLGSEAVKSLMQSRVQFGNPRDRLIHLTEETFTNSGTELNDIYRQQMQNQFDFYYMTLSINLLPERAARFLRLNCELDLGQQEAQEPIIQTLFPMQQWRSILSFGVGMDVVLDGDLDWNVGVDSSQLGVLSESLPGELKAKVGNKNNLKAFLALPSYQYDLGRPDIFVTGEGNSIGYWRIQDQELQKLGTLRLGIVFKVPQTINAITLKGKVWAEPNMNWLTADLADVFYVLGQRFKSIFDREDEAAKLLSRGREETWELPLPKII